MLLVVQKAVQSTLTEDTMKEEIFHIHLEASTKKFNSIMIRLIMSHDNALRDPNLPSTELAQQFAKNFL